MKRMIRTALLIAACGAALPVFAQSQSAMNAAATRDAKTDDQALNAQYRTTTASLSPASRLLLRGAQRAWIGFRDQECKFEASGVAGGSAYPMVYAGCLKRLSDQRTEQLHRRDRCEEGDLACPR